MASVTVNEVPYDFYSMEVEVATEEESTWLKSWFDFLCDKSRELKIPLADLEMLFNFSYAHKGEVLHTDTLVGVKLAEIGNSHSRSPDGLQVTSPLSVMDIFFDGVNVFGETLASDE
jgi:hypothetical protein